MSENLVDNWKNLIPFDGFHIDWDANVALYTTLNDYTPSLTLDVNEGVTTTVLDGSTSNPLSIKLGGYYSCLVYAFGYALGQMPTFKTNSNAMQYPLFFYKVSSLMFRPVFIGVVSNQVRTYDTMFVVIRVA